MRMEAIHPALHGMQRSAARLTTPEVSTLAVIEGFKMKTMKSHKIPHEIYCIQIHEAR